MKKSDILTISCVAVVVGLLVFFGLQFVLGKQTMQPVAVEVATPIESTVVPPSSAIFNENAINPTVPITIEGGDRQPIGN